MGGGGAPGVPGVPGVPGGWFSSLNLLGRVERVNDLSLPLSLFLWSGE